MNACKVLELVSNNKIEELKKRKRGSTLNVKYSIYKG